MAVSPAALTALKAYSTWYNRPSGLNTVMCRSYPPPEPPRLIAPRQPRKAALAPETHTPHTQETSVVSSESPPIQKERNKKQRKRKKKKQKAKAAGILLLLFSVHERRRILHNQIAATAIAENTKPCKRDGRSESRQAQQQR